MVWPRIRFRYCSERDMSWWGKVVGGTFGFMMGGPLGALMGAALGNYFDGGLDNTLGLGATERVQSVFFSTTFTVMGYLAKADGRVTQHEIAMAERVMAQMQLNTQQRQVAMRLFNEGKKEGFPIHEVLGQFKREIFRRRSLAQMFLEIIIATAYADGHLHSTERRVLEDIAREIGFSSAQFDELLSRLAGQAQFGSQQSVNERLPAAYELLGVTADVSEADLKRAYRRQMSQHHPDKLVAKGLPEEMIEIATARTRDIKAAYELIKSQRGQ